MKIRTSIALAGAAGALILNANAHAVYTGLIVELSDFYFANHPNQAVRDAWNAGPDSQFHIYRLYATFNSNTPADRVNAVGGTSVSPLKVNCSSGTFHNYTEDYHGKTFHFNTAYTGGFPPERSWDTYVTIGNAMSAGDTLLTPGFAAETNNLGHEASSIQSSSALWWVLPTSPQGQAVASAPGQTNAPPGMYRVLLGQFVIPQNSGMWGNFLVNVNGQDYANQIIFFEPPPVYGDATGDGIVDVNDLLTVINAWGPCPQGCFCSGDVSPPHGGDCVVNVSDLLMVINNWTD